MKNILVFSVFFLFLDSITFSQSIISASDFGVIPDSKANASPGISRAIEACKKVENATLILPGGRIDLWPDGTARKELYVSNSTEDDTLPKERNIAFWFENFKNLVLEGNNTLVILHGKMISFAMVNCENITIQNIRFDYERPTMSELSITSVNDSCIETIIHPDSKYSIDNGRMGFVGEGWKNKSYHTILFKPGKELMNYSSFNSFLNNKADETSPFHVKFTGDFLNTGFQEGDILTIRDPYRDNCGGFINLSRNIRLENVKMHYIHGLGIVSQFSENVSFYRVVAAPRQNSGRIISCFADCFHFSGCKGRICLDSCRTSGSHDDPVNIHGTHLKITQIENTGQLTVRFMHPQTYGFKAFYAGDSIAFINPETLQPIAFTKLRNAVLVDKRTISLELEEPLPLLVKPGDCIENLSWTPEVFIRNCYFERTNTRGLLISTRRKVLIENNTFYRTGMQAILIADDAKSWYESGPVQDVTIRNNTFTGCGYNLAPGNYVISIVPENHQLIQGFYIHQNIRIENNAFNVYDFPILSARSVENLIFTGNSINKTDFLEMGDKRPGFDFIACRKVTVKNNMLRSMHTPYIRIKEMTQEELKTDWIVEQ